MDKPKRYYFGAYKSYLPECMKKPHCEFHKLDSSPGNEALYCDNPNGFSLRRCPLSLIRTVGDLMDIINRTKIKA